MVKSILVVEDNVEIAENLCCLLEKKGYQTLPFAVNYDEAIKTFTEEAPDLTILDVCLEGKLTGIDVANFIRKNSDKPFIYHSGSTDSKSLELAKATKPYAFLVKPVQFINLQTAVEFALNSYVPNEQVTSLSKLTPMEKVVIREIAQNKTTKLIANVLDLSESTVKNHRHNICHKLNLPTTTHSLVNWVLLHKEKLVL